MADPTEGVTLAEQIEAVESAIADAQNYEADDCKTALFVNWLRAAAATLRELSNGKWIAPSRPCGAPVYGGTWTCGNFVRGGGLCHKHRNPR